MTHHPDYLSVLHFAFLARVRTLRLDLSPLFPNSVYVCVGIACFSVMLCLNVLLCISVAHNED